MCGAFSIVLAPHWWADIFDVPKPSGWQPVYNARPGEILPVITQEQPHRVTEALWNYVPHWMKDPKGRGVINARAETAATKPYFRSSFKSKRCIIPADGFYEWERKGKIKVPYRFVHREEKPFAFAGLYDELPDSTGNIGFTIITTEANDLVGKIHDRMPVIFDKADEKHWLDPKFAPDKLQSLLRPYPAEEMKMFAVSRRVNIAKNKDNSVIEPVGEQASLV